MELKIKEIGELLKHKEFLIGVLFFVPGIIFISGIDISVKGFKVDLDNENSYIAGVILLPLSLYFFIKSTIRDKDLYNKKMPIEKHPIFIVLRRGIADKLDMKGKFLSIKFEFWLKYLETIVTSKQVREDNYFGGDNGGKLFTYITQEQAKAIEAYKQEWRANGFKEETIKTFCELHKETLESIMNHLATILDSKFYIDSHFRLIEICNAHLFLFDLTKHSFEKAIKDGKLTIEKN